MRATQIPINKGLDKKNEGTFTQWNTTVVANKKHERFSCVLLHELLEKETDKAKISMICWFGVKGRKIRFCIACVCYV